MNLGGLGRQEYNIINVIIMIMITTSGITDDRGWDNIQSEMSLTLGGLGKQDYIIIIISIIIIMITTSRHYRGERTGENIQSEYRNVSVFPE